MKNTTLCGKILHFVVNYSFSWYNITFLWYNITFCSIFVVYLWYICDIFVVFFAMGNNWLIVTDAYYKCPCIHQTSSTSNQATTTLLEEDFAHFGYPHTIVSDNATTFSSAEFQLWCHQGGIKHLTGAPYHPATNGAAERMVQSFKHSLKKSKLPPRPALQEFLMQYRRTPLNTGFSPSQLLNGRQLRTKIDALLPSPAHIAQEHQAREATKSQQKEQTAVQHVRTAYDVGTPCYALYCSPRQTSTPRWVPESMVLKHSPSRFIPEDHYGNVTWNNFNLATELPRIPTPVSSSVNNPHQLTVF